MGVMSLDNYARPDQVAIADRSCTASFSNLVGFGSLPSKLAVATAVLKARISARTSTGRTTLDHPWLSRAQLEVEGWQTTPGGLDRAPDRPAWTGRASALRG